MKQAQKALKALDAPVVIHRKQNAIADVQSAIARGLRTREEIQVETKLRYDIIGDAIAELVYEKKVVRIKRVGQQRELVLVA